MNRRLLSIPSALVLAGALAACHKGPEKILIGVNVELTGSIPVAGQSCKNAAEFAVETVNAAGGLEVAGKRYPVEILVEDNEDKAESAAAAAQKLVSAGSWRWSARTPAGTRSLPRKWPRWPRSR